MLCTDSLSNKYFGGSLGVQFVAQGYFSIPAGRVGDPSTNLPFVAQSAPAREPHPSQLPITSYLFQNKHLYTTKLCTKLIPVQFEICQRSEIKLITIHVYISSIIDLEKSFKCVNGSNTHLFSLAFML